MEQNRLILFSCLIQYISIVYFDFRKETIEESSPSKMFANVFTEIYATGDQLHISNSNLITQIYHIENPSGLLTD